MHVSFYTLGCKVNLYETEVVMSIFKKKGYEIVDFNSNADVVVINTCTVTNTSDAKDRNIIRQAIKNNPNAVIIVMGCFSQVKSEEVKKLGANIIIGNSNKTKVVELLEEYLKNKENICIIDDIRKTEFEDMSLDKFETRTRAFVKIQDGCNNFCSYCLIPYARGGIRSKEKDKVVKEITSLVENGYKEVVLTGIHTGHYGKEKYDYDFSDLLNELSLIDGLKRIRISSIEITELDDKFMSVLKNKKVIVDHIHIPLQSGCDKTLKDMNRKYDTEYFYNKIELIRNIRPGISITTDVIVGFPGETDADFNSTCDFIKRVNFSKVHVFPYSRRSGTKADTMPMQVDEKVKKERTHSLLQISKDLELSFLEKEVGKIEEVLFEKYEEGYVTGHTSNYTLVKSIGDISLLNKFVSVVIEKVEYPYVIGTINK